MATVVTPPEQRIVLDHITSWEVYGQLLATHRDRSVPRFTYDRGRLEIISPSAEHEELRHMVALFVEVIAEEMHINTNPSLAKFPISAQLGVPEVWHYDGRQWQIFQLVGEQYVKQVQSTVFPALTAETLTNLLDENRCLERLAWLQRVRTWIREQRTGEIPR